MSKLSDFKQSALRVIDIEKTAITQLNQYINDDFEQACELLFNCRGRVIIIGMGKSGHIGRKIAATLASTGTPAFFVHPGEASHGDLGMITAEDCVLLISNSGETQEVLSIIPVIKRIGAKIIGMSGKPQSSLAEHADVHLCIAVPQEACSLGLAPTASTTATLVMGDALAIALLDAKGFTEIDFALSHPGGALGKRLLLKVADIMCRDSEVPIVLATESIKAALLEISSKGLGFTSIIGANKEVIGIFTDGDLRRLLDNAEDIHHTPIEKVMTTNCLRVKPELLAAEALHILQEKKINALVVVNEQNQPIGAFNMHHLLKAGIL